MYLLKNVFWSMGHVCKLHMSNTIKRIFSAMYLEILKLINIRSTAMFISVGEHKRELN